MPQGNSIRRRCEFRYQSRGDLFMSRKQNALIAVAISAVLGSATCGLVLAQTQAGTTVPGSEQTTNNSSVINAKDKQFMRKAAQAGMAEVEEGRVAADKAQSPKVKSFAERMVQDHTQAGDKLMQIAETLHVKLPTQPSDAQQKQLAKLRKLSAGEFDKTYDPMQVQDHKETVHEFEQEAKNVQNPALKEWVEGALPVLKEHLKLAQALPNNRG